MGSIVDGAVLARDLHPLKRLVLGADEAILFGLVAEEVPIQQSGGVDRALRGHMRRHPHGFAARCLLAVGVAGVGHEVESVSAKCFLRSLSHRLQLTVIGRIQHHGVCDDQRVLGIHSRLHVVGRNDGASALHQVGFRLGVPLQLLQRRSHNRGIDLGLQLDRRPSRSWSDTARAPGARARSTGWPQRGTAFHPPTPTRHGSDRSRARTAPVRLPRPPPHRDACDGTPRSTYGPDTDVPAATSAPRCAGNPTQPPRRPQLMQIAVQIPFPLSALAVISSSRCLFCRAFWFSPPKSPPKSRAPILEPHRTHPGAHPRTNPVMNPGCPILDAQFYRAAGWGIERKRDRLPPTPGTPSLT